MRSGKVFFLKLLQATVVSDKPTEIASACQDSPIPRIGSHPDWAAAKVAPLVGWVNLVLLPAIA
jgi:hypothetical protein